MQTNSHNNRDCEGYHSFRVRREVRLGMCIVRLIYGPLPPLLIWRRSGRVVPRTHEHSTMNIRSNESQLFKDLSAISPITEHSSEHVLSRDVTQSSYCSDLTFVTTNRGKCIWPHVITIKKKATGSVRDHTHPKTITSKKTSPLFRFIPIVVNKYV